MGNIGIFSTLYMTVLATVMPTLNELSLVCKINFIYNVCTILNQALKPILKYFSFVSFLQVMHGVCTVRMKLQNLYFFMFMLI